MLIRLLRFLFGRSKTAASADVGLQNEQNLSALTNADVSTSVELQSAATIGASREFARAITEAPAVLTRRQVFFVPLPQALSYHSPNQFEAERAPAQAALQQPPPLSESPGVSHRARLDDKQKTV